MEKKSSLEYHRSVNLHLLKPTMALFLFLILPLIPLVVTLIINRRNRNPKLPPGPSKIPIIGNLLQLLRAGDPHRAFRMLSQIHGPIMHLKLGQVDHIIISSADAARDILKTQDINFASRPELIGPTILLEKLDIGFAPYGSYWRHLRKICVLELLSARRVKSYLPIREAENSTMLASFISNSVGTSVIVNLTEKLFGLSNRNTGRAAFGTQCKHSAWFITVMREALELTSGFQIADLFPSLSFISRVFGMTTKLQRIKREMNFILDEIIEEHKIRKLCGNSPRSGEDEAEDLLDVLLRLKDDGEVNFPLAGVKAVILDMFVAGTDTTAATTIWAMAELVRNPLPMEKVQREVRQVANGKGKIEDEDLAKLRYMNLVIKETLRLHPPLPLLLPRTCGETCNVGGYQIPAQSRVIVNAWGIARNPNYFHDPECFIPERFDGSSLDFKGESFQFLPFGGGRRICPGMVFGLANLELTLAQLLFHFDWKPLDGDEVDMTECFGATLSKKSDLCLIATPRIPLPR